MQNRARAALVCGLVGVVLAVGCSGGGSDEDAKDTKSKRSSTTTSTFAGTGSPDFCPALGEVTSQSELLAQDPSASEAQRKERWDHVVETVDTLADEAPDEIKLDVEAVASVYRALRDTLGQYQYDVNQLPEAERNKLVSASAQQSADRLSAYDQQLCTGATTTTAPAP